MNTSYFAPGGILAAAVSLLLTSQQASAGLNYDLRVTGGGKTATVSFVGQTVSLDLYAQVTGTDANKAEGFQDGYGSVRSSDQSGQNIMGSISSSLMSSFMGNAYQPGKSQNLDTDTDFDLGSNQTVANGDFLFARSTTLPGAAQSGSPITNGTEFKLATIFFTVTSVSSFFNPAPITVSFVVPTFSSGVYIEALWQQDGLGTNSNGLNGGTQPTVNTGSVSIQAIPEPASASLLSLAGLTLAARRRSRK